MAPSISFTQGSLRTDHFCPQNLPERTLSSWGKEACPAVAAFHTRDNYLTISPFPDGNAEYVIQHQAPRWSGRCWDRRFVVRLEAAGRRLREQLNTKRGKRDQLPESLEVRLANGRWVSLRGPRSALRCRAGSFRIFAAHGHGLQHTLSMADAAKLKDYFTHRVVGDIGKCVQGALPSFKLKPFVDGVFAGDWDGLGFTARSRRIAEQLWIGVGLPVVEALDVLVAALPDELDDPEGVLNERFWLWPFGDAIAAYAVDEPDAALDACEALTKCFTSEFAVRPFLARYPKALQRAAIWARDPNQHVRRLASEGTRPRLPWATKLDLPLDEVLAILTTLRADPSLYVRRSVANHLNDLAKEDSDRIVALLESWHGEGVPKTSWIVRHAMRNHLKNGDPRVLALFDYLPARVEVADLRIEPGSVAIGEAVQIAFDLIERSGSTQKLMVDLVVGYVKSNGAIGPKVFKFKDFELESGATEACTKKLGMIVRNTRPLYPGEHSVTVRINCYPHRQEK